MSDGKNLPRLGDGLDVIMANIARMRAEAGPPMEDPPRHTPLRLLLDQARMPRLYRELAAKGVVDTPACRAVRAKRTRVILLSGPSGAGKTMAAMDAAFGRCQIDSETGIEQASAVCATADELVRVGMDEWLLRRLCTARLLVLDDIGRTYQRQDGQSYGMHTLGAILDAREQADLPIIATSNYTGADLLHRLGSDAEERARNWRRIDGDRWRESHVLLRARWDAKSIDMPDDARRVR